MCLKNYLLAIWLRMTGVDKRQLVGYWNTKDLYTDAYAQSGIASARDVLLGLNLG